MCKSHSEVVLGMVTRSRSFIRLATACGLWEDEDALNQFLTSRVMSLKPVWDEGSCEYFAGRLDSVTEQTNRRLLHSYVLKCALESWRSPKENSHAVGLADFARSLPGFSESQVCSEPLMAEHVADRGVRISENIEHMWMCGGEIRGDLVCWLREDPLKYFLPDYAWKHVDFSIFFADFKATKMLASIDECTDAQRSELVNFIVVALGDMQRTYQVTDAELAGRISDMDPLFCDHNNDILGRYRHRMEELARAICPTALFAKQYERKHILASTLKAWLMSPETNGLRSFAQSFTPLAESNICRRAELDAFIDYMVQSGEPEPLLTELLWVCGIELPAKVVCLPIERFGRSFVREYHSKGAEVSEFLFDFEATGVLDVIDQCPAEQQDSSVGSLIRLFGEIQNVYQLTDIQLRAALAGREKLEYFCRFNQNVLQMRPADELDLVTILCPNTPRSIEALRRIVHSVPRPIRSKVLRVRSTHPFTDALGLLTDKFVEADVPSGIVLDGEVAPTPIHDWLRLAGQEAASLLITQDGTQIQSNAPQQQYYAFGRLIAIAAMREGTLGIHFPENFFRELLTRRSGGDHFPISPIDIIREGLEYFYPVPRILEQLTPEEFGIMFT